MMRFAMRTDLNSDGGWLRRLIEVMDAIDSQRSGPSTSKRATQGLLERLRLPANRMSDHVSSGLSSPFSPRSFDSFMVPIADSFDVGKLRDRSAA
jgi:hypothetical protein